MLCFIETDLDYCRNIVKLRDKYKLTKSLPTKKIFDTLETVEAIQKRISEYDDELSNTSINQTDHDTFVNR